MYILFIKTYAIHYASNTLGFSLMLMIIEPQVYIWVTYTFLENYVLLVIVLNSI